jgi:Ca-activated chloride channel family protein
MSIRFLHLGALHWLWLVLAVAIIVWIGFVLRRRRLRRLAPRALLARLTPTASTGRQILRASLLLAAMVALVAALIDPRWGFKKIDVQQRGIDIAVVLDVSRSMLAQDVQPNRLERAKQAVSDLVERLSGDRIGLITTAGTASLKCPLTVDYGAFRLSLEEVQPESEARGGSLIGDGLRIAVDAFTDEIKDHKVIILLSDGEDHGSYPLEAARKLQEEYGIRVFTVGIGDADEGARIPVEIDGQRVFLTYNGEEVWTRMDAQGLRDLALAGGGAFIPAGTRQVDLGEVYEEKIEPVTKRELDVVQMNRRRVRYQWFAGLALALMLLETCISDRKNVHA